ncbi:hypothetical protein GRI62_00630 [Erythrobacter arachoides]|uniref:Uncharacterized protein n=1 Tax=Aurantiacibacter arachoides TaxID=1850444 RepID=A0A844ZY28_9SPHN|nr:hypothetical protein [Aurantiacibacter arachoides]
MVTAMAAGSILLGGCTAYGGDPLGGLLGGLLGGGGYGNTNTNLSQFEQAAADACGREAQRYGRVQLTNVQQATNDTVRVDGRIETRDTRNDEFTCTFRSDNRIVDFRTG